MARTAITPQQIVMTGLNMTTEAANVDGNSFSHTKPTALYVDNQSGGNVVVTIPSVKTVDGLAVTDRTVTVPTGESRWVGPFTDVSYQTGTNTIYVDYDVVTSVTVAVVTF